jgi:isopentenyldiphosphate isomerase
VSVNAADNSCAGREDSGDAEMLSVVSPTGDHSEPAGRLEVHQQGLWHEVFHCLIVRSAPPARVVLQRRRAKARSFAGLLDLTVTGHLQAGETPLDGVREMREELGIIVAPSELVSLGRRLLADDSGEGHNRELAHVFLLADDRPLTEYPLNADEVGGVVEMSVEDLLALSTPGSTHVAECDFVAVDGAASRIECTVDDLVPSIDGYWTVIAVMAERFAQGRRPLAI